MRDNETVMNVIQDIDEVVWRTCWQTPEEDEEGEEDGEEKKKSGCVGNGMGGPLV